ncbi:MAG: M24 family metallopeptidase [Armatimonadota bacterium]
MQHDYPARLRALQETLQQRDVDLAVLNLNSDLYYYTGSVRPLYLLVPARGEALVLARKAVVTSREDIKHLPVHEFSGTQDLRRILETAGLLSAKRLGFTLDTAAYATVTRLQRFFTGAELVDITWDIRTLRMVKSPAEIEILTRACAVMDEMPRLLREHFRPGMSELELSMVMEAHFRRHGHGMLVRCRREGIEVAGGGVCCAGENTLYGTKFDGICGGKGLSTAFPFGPSYDPIPQGIPVLLDYSFVLEGYHADLTRMFCWGTPSDEVMNAYGAMCRIEQEIFDAMRPGALWEELYARSVERATEFGYAKEFMGVDADKVKFVGHGLGLELDEPPFLAPNMPYPLAANEVIAIEPKVALPGIGVVGIEDTVLVGAEGPEWLTRCGKEMVVV